MRALKYNGGVAKADLKAENLEALKKGICNLEAHIDNIAKYGVPCVVAINRFDTDTDAELKFIEDTCKRMGAEFALSDVFAKGGDGGIELAEKVVASCEKASNFKPIYEDSLSICEKIEKVAKEIYGADGVNFTAPAGFDLTKGTPILCNYKDNPASANSFTTRPYETRVYLFD